MEVLRFEGVDDLRLGPGLGDLDLPLFREGEKCRLGHTVVVGLIRDRHLRDSIDGGCWRRLLDELDDFGSDGLGFRELDGLGRFRFADSVRCRTVSPILLARSFLSRAHLRKGSSYAFAVCVDPGAS